MGEGGMSQAAIDKIVNDRIADIKQQRDDARAQLAERDATIGALKKEAGKLEKLVGAATPLQAEVDTLKAELASQAQGFEQRLAFTGVLGADYDADVAEFVSMRYGRIEGDDRPAFADYLAAQASDASTLVGRLVGAQPAEAEGANGAAPPAAPTPNRGAAQPRTPARQSTDVATASATQWEQMRQAAGLKPRGNA